MTLSIQMKPRFQKEVVEEYLAALYGLIGIAEPLPAELDQNFRLAIDNKPAYVIKIANRARKTLPLEFENQFMNLLGRKWQTGAVPQIVKSIQGNHIEMIQDEDGHSYSIRVLTFVVGVPLSQVGPLEHEAIIQIGRAIGDLDRCANSLTHPGMIRESVWDLAGVGCITDTTNKIKNVQRRGLVDRLLVQYLGRILPVLDELPLSVIHNDVNDENLLMKQTGVGEWMIAGVIDLGDSVYSHTINELAILCAYLILRVDDPFTVILWAAKGYHQSRPLSKREARVLFPLVCMRLCQSVTMSAIAAEDDPDNPHRQITDALAWVTLEKLESIDWEVAGKKVMDVCGLKRNLPQTIPEEVDLLHRRQTRLGPSLSLSYEQPLEIIRGLGQYLFDQQGWAYLDCVNNICHIGHSHPRVVEGLASQAAILNTNTRYLHPTRLDFADRLIATLPEPLSVCFFVNSGSEANELAVRLARAHTGRQDVIVIDGAYHGNTQTLVDLSPYKCEGPGGKGLAAWAHKVTKPDHYHGKITGEDTGRQYAADVIAVCDRLVSEDRPPALFLAEAILACGGQIVPPDGYLQAAFEAVRAVDGLCAIDEVQVGMGRVGSSWWAFESHRVVPDIVTIGKPLGNGHPMAAVVTTPEIAQSFANGMEYFNSFGGNPVSMAVGMAVMDVIEEEGLRENASRVGDYLMKGFRELAVQHPEIGDVRGMGLFIGVEIVLDTERRVPATQLTKILIEKIKQDHILLSSEGPDLNVIKIKPPLVFTTQDADLVLGAVDRHMTALRRG